jgi:hypothetical protein
MAVRGRSGPGRAALRVGSDGLRVSVPHDTEAGIPVGYTRPQSRCSCGLARRSGTPCSPAWVCSGVGRVPPEPFETSAVVLRRRTWMETPPCYAGVWEGEG